MTLKEYPLTFGVEIRMRFLYVMDPMCAWCYGFQPELEQFLSNHPPGQFEWVMGGLAPDSDQPMAEELRQTISSYWHQIEEKTQVSFNYDFWTLNTPYRSTYQACRAVIAAESLKEDNAKLMVKAIQSAYYKEAKNPSLQETLISCASKLGIDESSFSDALNSKETEQQLQQHLALSRHLQVTGFPALFYLDAQNQATPLTLGFCPSAYLEQGLHQITEKMI